MSVISKFCTTFLILILYVHSGDCIWICNKTAQPEGAESGVMSAGTSMYHLPHDDPIYMKETGKTYDQLLASGEYVSMDVFGNITESSPQWKDYAAEVPEKRTEAIDSSHVSFMFYSLQNRNGVNVQKNLKSMKAVVGWNSNVPLKVLVHGYINHGHSDMPTTLKDAYLATKTAANIIVIDWGFYASLRNLYVASSSYTEPVGILLGQFLEFLKDNGFIASLNSVHIIGHSLGAHLAGHVGKYFKGKSQSIGRITGLDPAGPGFSDAPNRLVPSDAKFVDVIHTNAGHLVNLNPLTGFTGQSAISFGIIMPSGHADFYPNGGRGQPHCGVLPFIGELVGTCNHAKAFMYYADSIKIPNKYKGCQCDGIQKITDKDCECAGAPLKVMGEHCDPKTSGTFYLTTE